MENNEREPDSFDRALQAEAMISESEIRRLTEEEEQDFLCFCRFSGRVMDNLSRE